jgi:hypothetical protein
MPFRDRGYINLPLIKINYTRNGLKFRFTSYTWHLGPWSRNSRTKKHHIDHPGPGWWESKSRSKKRGTK